MERHPGRQQDHFHGNSGEIFPWKLPEQRKIQLAESVHARNTAQAQYVGARLKHERQIGRIAGEFEGEVGFYRGVDFARAGEINVPATVRELALENVLRATLLQLGIDLAEPMHVEHVIRAKGAIDKQLATPMPIRLLLPQQVLLRTRNGRVDIGIGRLINRLHPWAGSRQ